MEAIWEMRPADCVYVLIVLINILSINYNLHLLEIWK